MKKSPRRDEEIPTEGRTNPKGGTNKSLGRDFFVPCVVGRFAPMTLGAGYKPFYGEKEEMRSISTTKAV